MQNTKFRLTLNVVIDAILIHTYGCLHAATYAKGQQDNVHHRSTSSTAVFELSVH